MKSNAVEPVKLGKKVAQLVPVDYSDPKNWPLSLQNFIKRCFTKSNELNFNKELKDQFQLQLKKIIDKAIAEKKVDQNDWNAQKLPIFDYSFKKLELMCNLPPTVDKIKKTGLLLLPTSGLVKKKISMKIPKPTSGILQKPSPLTSMQQRQKSSSPSPIQRSPSPFMSPKSDLSATRLSSPSGFGDSVVPIKRTLQDPSSKTLKKQKLQRFLQESSPTPQIVKQHDDLNMPLIGTCQTLEKNYLRLTSEPNPELVRPLPVLKKTLRLLRSKYEKEKNYNYLKNQLKSLRQDITVQHIKNKFTIKLYEFHSKIAIEFKDLGEFNQCQSQLKQLYQLNQGKHKNKYEFYGYRILYFIITRDNNEIMALKLLLLQNEPELLTNEFIMMALKFWDYTLTNNYHDLFQLYENLLEVDKTTMDKGEVNDEDDEVSMNNLNHSKFYYFIKLLTDFIIEKQLLTTFQILSRSYKKLSLDFLSKELFLNDSTNLNKFLQEKKLTTFVIGDYLELSQAKPTIFELNISTRKIDIKGQI